MEYSRAVCRSIRGECSPVVNVAFRSTISFWEQPWHDTLGETPRLSVDEKDGNIASRKENLNPMHGRQGS